MRNRNTQGFTLIELLIVIAIIGILAAVLIPNLLNARARAFDSGAQTCLRELSTQLEVVASNTPFAYTPNTLVDTAPGATVDAAAVNACDRVHLDWVIEVDDFAISARHDAGTNTYITRNGIGVVTFDQDPGGATGTDPSDDPSV